MNDDEIKALVNTSARVRVGWGVGGGVYVEGTVIAALLAPSLTVLRDDGTRETVSTNLPIEILSGAVPVGDRGQQT